jgi:hypothetical protein
MQEILRRAEYSEARIASLIERLKGESLLSKHPNLCIYVTGSFGRLEAACRSDVDVFFLHTGSAGSTPLTRVEKTLIDASIITACRDLRFPEFTKGGVYLDVHYIDDVLEKLGSPQDDALNYFTARMLLLTESKLLVNEDLYRSLVRVIIDSYFRDFHDHEKNFQPIFLVNDLIRYWKTICLNYEAKRNRRDKEGLEKTKEHVKNFKLKFSRILTCFSFVASILAIKDGVVPDAIVEICLQTPLQRLDQLSSTSVDCEKLVSKLKHEYDWFLLSTSRNEQEVSEWIADRDNRNSAFGRARQFGEQMFELLQMLAGDQKTLRYLVV